MPVTPAIGRLRQEDLELEAIQGYMARPYLNDKKKEGKERRKGKKAAWECDLVIERVLSIHNPLQKAEF
jgi:hypothetical protein